MGYLNNNTITIDAILTKKGREKLAKANFNITKFAVADDGVDYSLYTTSHPLGSSYYGSIIENTPLPEAIPDETQVMRYKLVTLPKGSNQIPIISLGFANIQLQFGVTVNAFPINPSTTSGLNGPGLGYTAILHNSDAATLVGTGLASTANFTAPAILGDASTANAVVAQGMTFTLSPKDIPSQITTSITIIGNETGATITIPVVVTPKPTI